MNIGRRRLAGALVLGTGFKTAVNGQPPGITAEDLRGASVVHGNPLSGARLEVIKPALERRLSELRALRTYEIDDTVGPTHGILT